MAVGAFATVVMRALTVFNIKTLIAAVLFSGVAAATFAQVPAVAAPKAATADVVSPRDAASRPKKLVANKVKAASPKAAGTATAPSDAASKPKHKAKHKAKKRTAKKVSKAAKKDAGTSATVR